MCQIKRTDELDNWERQTGIHEKDRNFAGTGRNVAN